MYNDFRKKLEETVGIYGKQNLFSYMRDNETTETMSYEQMYNIICCVTKKLEEIGLRRGDRVALISAVCPSNLLTGLCLSYAGITSVLLDASLPKEELVRLISFSNVRAIFASNELYDLLHDSFHDSLDFFKLIDSENLEAYDTDICNSMLKTAPTTDADEDVIAIIFSSGTTGTMKGIKVTYKSVLVSDHTFNKLLGDFTKKKFLYVFPFNHIAGFVLFFISVFRGWSLGLIESMNASKLQKTLLEFCPNVFAMVPKIFEVMEQKIRAKVREKGKVIAFLIDAMLEFSYFLRVNFGINLGKYLFKGIRNQVFGTQIEAIGGGGAKFSASNVKFFFSLGLEWVDVYASTETGVPCTSTCFGDRLVVGTEGNVYAFPEIQIAIGKKDVNGHGEVLVKSELMMKGYFRQPELTQESFDENGYFKTGDLGYIDNKGNLHVTGRIKESIVLESGKKVSPTDVDNYYFEKLPQYELASRGIPDKDNQYDKIHLFVQDATFSAEEKKEIYKLISEVSAQAPSMYQLGGIHFIKKIEKTSIGKVKRNLLIIDDEKVDIEEEVHTEIISDEEKFFAIIKEKCTGLSVSMEHNLKKDLGLESLDMYEIITDLEAAFHVELLSKVDEIRTVGDLYDTIKNGSAVIRKRESFDVSKYPLQKSERDKKRLISTMKLTQKIWEFEVEGLENIPQDENYIICPNHETHFDGLFVFSALYKTGKLDIDKICCMAKKEHLDHWITRDWLKMLGGIPVDREGMSAKSIQRSKQCIKDGYIFLIHPEGTRTRNGELGEFKSGAAKLAAETNKKILPVRIDGAYEIYPYKRLVPKFFDWKHFRKYKLRISFGVPMQRAEETVKEFTVQLRDSIINMRKE